MCVNSLLLDSVKLSKYVIFYWFLRCFESKRLFFDYFLCFVRFLYFLVNKCSLLVGQPSSSSSSSSSQAPKSHSQIQDESQEQEDEEDDDEKSDSTEDRLAPDRRLALSVEGGGRGRGGRRGRGTHRSRGGRKNNRGDEALVDVEMLQETADINRLEGRQYDNLEIQTGDMAGKREGDGNIQRQFSAYRMGFSWFDKLKITKPGSEDVLAFDIHISHLK